MKRKFMSCLFSTLLLLGLTATYLLTGLPFDLDRTVRASSSVLKYPSDGDAWTENDNATYPWTCQSSYKDTMAFTTAKSKVGSYSLNLNHTSATTAGWWGVDFGTQNLSAYWAVSFWFRMENKATKLAVTMRLDDARFASGTTGTLFSLAFRVEQNTWYRMVFPLVMFTKSGSVSLGNIRYLDFVLTLGSADGTRFYVDGLKFMSDSEDVSITNSLDNTALANLYSTLDDAERIYILSNGSKYTGLSCWMTVATGAQQGGNLDAEALGQTIFILSYLYNMTQWDFYLDKAKLYANWLLQYQNQTYGYMWYYYNNATKVFSGDPSPVVTGWSLAGMSFLYGMTNNETYKNSADKMRSWFCDRMWGGTGWYESWNKTGAMSYGAVMYGGMDGGGAHAGLGTYYKYVAQNTTVKSHINIAFSINYALYIVRSQGVSPKHALYWGKIEDCSYAFWGFYMNSLSPMSNSTFLGVAKYIPSVLLVYNHYWANGSLMEGFGQPCFINTTDSNYYWVNWAQIAGLPITYRMAKTYDTSALIHLDKVFRDWLPAVKGNYWQIWFNSGSSVYKAKAWQPTALFFYAALLEYYLDNISDPYVVATDKTLTSSLYSANQLTLTINASSGSTSTTKVYVGDKGEPTSVKGASSWSYDSRTKICTITVTHSSAKTVTLEWRALAGDVNGDGVVDIFDALVIRFAYWSRPGDPNWVPEADLNQDDAINSGDAIILIIHFGETC